MVYLEPWTTKFTMFYFWTPEKAQEALEKINAIGMYKNIPISSILKLDGNDWSQGEYEGQAPTIPMIC
jgi:hypothetical protein